MLGFNGGRIGIANTVFTGGDPNYSSVSLLLNGNGTNGSTTFADSSNYSHTVTANGNAQISTTQSKFGGASMYFDGSGDYLQTISSTAFDLSSGDWTIELWHRSTAYTSNNNVLVNLWTSSSDKIVIATIGTSGFLYYLLNGSIAISTSSSVAVGTWSHVALVKSGSTTTLYRDGVSIGTTNSTPNSSSKLVEIGTDRGEAYFNGYIDDLRITKGVARYTSNFTPPTAQLPGAETGTFASGLWTFSDHIKQIRNELWPGLVLPIVTDGLVVHLDAGDSASYPGSGTTWTDLSGNGNNATLFGTPSYTASPGYFDITSDSTYARLSSYSHLTNDFTYSMWVRFDAFDSYDTLIENGSYPDVGPLFRVQSTTSIAVYTENALRGTFTWSPSTNTWYNVVYTRSGSTNTLYVNGTQSGLTFTDQTNISLSNAYTFLMRSQHTTNQFTNGQLAQYAMYNKALTSSEITQNFDALKGRYGL